jgi:hypothetical protein
MIVVEVGHAHVIKFLPFHVNCQFWNFVAVTHFLGEKCGDENFNYFC